MQYFFCFTSSILILFSFFYESYNVLGYSWFPDFNQLAPQLFLCYFCDNLLKIGISFLYSNLAGFLLYFQLLIDGSSEFSSPFIRLQWL
jgi:hypothetical protein